MSVKTVFFFLELFDFIKSSIFIFFSSFITTPVFPLNLNPQELLSYFLEFLDCEDISLKKEIFSLSSNLYQSWQANITIYTYLINLVICIKNNEMNITFYSGVFYILFFRVTSPFQKYFS